MRLIVLFLFSYVVGYSQCSDFITITVNGDSCVIPTSSIQSIKPGPDGKAKLYACLKPEDLNCITDQLFSDLAIQLTDCFPEPDPIICPDCTVAPNFNLMAKAGETINIDAGLVGCSSWAIENSSTVNGLSTSISSNGMIVVQVPEDYDGTVTFNYTATCLSSNSECEDCSYGGNVVINVTCDPCPIAQDFVVDAEQGETLTFDIGNAACETYEIQDVSAVGGFTQLVSQSGIVTLVIDDDFEGQIGFEYQANCTDCECNYIGRINVDVEKICDPCPTAENFDVTTAPGETLTFDIIDEFCSNYEIQDVSAVGGFTQSVSGGVITVDFDDDFIGVVEFEYRADCTNCECSYEGRVIINVEPDNIPEGRIDIEVSGDNLCSNLQLIKVPDNTPVPCGTEVVLTYQIGQEYNEELRGLACSDISTYVSTLVFGSSSILNYGASGNVQDNAGWCFNYDDWGQANGLDQEVLIGSVRTGGNTDECPFVSSNPDNSDMECITPMISIQSSTPVGSVSGTVTASQDPFLSVGTTLFNEFDFVLTNGATGSFSSSSGCLANQASIDGICFTRGGESRIVIDTDCHLNQPYSTTIDFNFSGCIQMLISDQDLNGEMLNNISPAASSVDVLQGNVNTVTNAAGGITDIDATTSDSFYWLIFDDVSQISFDMTSPDGFNICISDFKLCNCE